MSTLEKDRKRALLDLEETRNQIREREDRISSIEKRVVADESEAIEKVEAFVDGIARNDLDGFAEELELSGAVKPNELPTDPWVIAALLDPEGVKRVLTDAVRLSGRFNIFNATGETESARGALEGLHRTEKQQQQRLRNLEVPESEWPV